MKRIKRFFTVFLCSVYIVSSVSNSYMTVRAAAIPIVYSSWEVVEMIFLSFGVTFGLSETSLGQEFIGELEDCFELFMWSNGYDDPEQTIRDFQMCIEEGKNGIISLSNNLWNALKDWTQSFTSVSEDAYVENMTNTVACPAGTEAYFEMKLNELARLGSIVILDGAIFVDNEIHVKVTYNTTTSGVAWVWDAFYLKWTLRSNDDTSKRDIWYDYSIHYDALTGKYSYVCNDRLPRYIGADTIGGVMEEPSVAYRYIPKNSTVSSSGAFAPDVYFPKENLAYDICYLPGYDLVNSIANGSYDVITPGRTWDGTDVAGDVIITMPTDVASDLPFQGVYDGVVAGDIPFVDVLDDAGVIPVDTTLDRDLVDGDTISGAIVDNVIDQSPSIDDTKDDVDDDGNVIQTNVPLTFDLSKLFPFCIPFDIIDFLGLLSAPPVAPHIQYPIQYPTFNGTETYMLDIDLAQFDDVAALLRKMETLLFIVGLAGITRNHMIRG